MIFLKVLNFKNKNIDLFLKFLRIKIYDILILILIPIPILILKKS